MSRIKDIRSKGIKMVIGASLVVYLVFLSSSSMADLFYGRWIFRGIRLCYDYTLGWSPVAMFYVVLPLLVIYLGQSFWNRPIMNALIQFALRLLLLVCLFYWFWGFNYLRPTVKERMSLEIPTVDTSLLYSFYTEVLDSAAHTRKRINSSEADLENPVREAAAMWMSTNGLSVPGRPRIRPLRPGGILLGLSTAGVYIPYTFECHVDAGLHPLILPFIMAHEIAHGFGVTDEGECNFIGAMACVESPQPALRYAGYLQMVRWAYVGLRQAGYDEDGIYRLIPGDIQQDLKEIRARHDSYSRYFPERWRDVIYNSYLQAQGVSSGLKSYGEALGLILAQRAMDGHSENQY